MTRYSFLPLLLALITPTAWSLEALEGWMRALPPGQPTGAAYMTLRNTGSAPVVVVGASSPAAQRVEIHQSSQVDGMWRMVRLQNLEIAPGATVTLAPGGTHLMLFGLKASPRPGDGVSLNLELAGGDTLAVDITVLAPGSDTSDTHHHH